MYELMGLLGILETTAFIHAFVYRRRGYLILFALWRYVFSARAKAKRREPD